MSEILNVTIPPQWTTTGTLVNGQPTVTIPDTTYVLVGFPVTGTGIPVGASVVSVNSSTQFTLNVNATVSGSETLTLPQEPISLAEAKQQLRVDITDDDAVISRLISAARRYVEPLAQRTFLTTTYDLLLDMFPFSGGYYNRIIRQQVPSLNWLPTYTAIIDIIRVPVQVVNSFSYIDQSGNQQFLTLGTQYLVEYGKDRCRISPAYGQVYPIPRPTIGSVDINFTAGYGGPSALPADLKQGMMLVLDAYYQSRGGMDLDFPKLEESVLRVISGSLPGVYY